MTITQTIVMVGIGSLLIQPIAKKDTGVTLIIGLILTLLMVISFFETIFSGKAVIVIKDGKLRLTVDRLETRLRQSGIGSFEDIKFATIEVSGQIISDKRHEGSNEP